MEITGPPIKLGEVIALFLNTLKVFQKVRPTGEVEPQSLLQKH